MPHGITNYYKLCFNSNKGNKLWILWLLSEPVCALCQAFIGAGMCALSMTVAAWGVTQVWTTIISTVGRNPQVKKEVDIYGWAGFAAVEAIALYALVIALVMLTGK